MYSGIMAEMRKRQTYQQEYYQKHREKKLAYRKLYYTTNKARIQEQNKKHRRLHKDTRKSRHWAR